MEIQENNSPETPINIIYKCNQRCIFCSRGDLSRFNEANEADIRKMILAQKDTISFEGGEPTLHPKLVEFIRLAKSNGTRDIILATNGVVLFYKKFCVDILEAGTNVVNIAMPTHLDDLNDTLTGTKGFLKLRLRGIQNLMDLGYGKNTRLTFVVNSLNYKTMPAYTSFIIQNFPDIFYIEFNMIKVMGWVTKNTSLVPKLSDIAPYLNESMRLCAQYRIRCIIDGFPLCYIPGFEDISIDAFKMLKKRYTFLDEKGKTPKCQGCTLGNICAGPRVDYIQLYGDNEIYPSTKNPAEIIAKITQQMM